MQFGKDVEKLEAMHDAGRHVPAIENRPSLTGWGWLWDAFWTLNSCRSVGMAPGPIPWTAIQRYAEVEEMNAEEAYIMHAVIRHLDDQLLAYHRKQAEAKSKTSARNQRSSSRGVSRG